jgi:predicted nucleotidyltransferase
LPSKLRSLYGPRLCRLVLYGSEARKEALPDSGVGILAALDGLVKPADEIQRSGAIATSLTLEYGKLISLAFVPEDRFRGERSPFLMNVRREAVAV